MSSADFKQTEMLLVKCNQAPSQFFIYVFVCMFVIIVERLMISGLALILKININLTQGSREGVIEMELR